LERATNDDGVTFAKMKFLAGRHLTPQELQILASHELRLKQLLDPVVNDADNYAEEAAATPRVNVAPKSQRRIPTSLSNCVWWAE
jgi:hypothetical protein